MVSADAIARSTKSSSSSERFGLASASLIFDLLLGRLRPESSCGCFEEATFDTLLFAGADDASHYECGDG
eukprot:m.159105 g.159105  ORF g.159105 m.159105 type:complete len:70 (+) comp53005_c0_seq42:1257-1466(+)